MLLNLRLEAITTVQKALNANLNDAGETSRRGKGSSYWNVEEALQFIDKLDLCVCVDRFASMSIT